MDQFHDMVTSVKTRIQTNFRFATIQYIFILLFINLFQRLFGAPHSMVGIIFIQIMMATMIRDMTATPVKYFLSQSLLLAGMSLAACLSVNLPAVLALGINFAMLFLLLYLYSNEVTHQLYFPYVLSYLFMVFLAPIGYHQLPLRLVSILAGCLGMIIYQLVNGHHRTRKTSKAVLLHILQEAVNCLDSASQQQMIPKEHPSSRHELSKLSQMLYDRRKRAFCMSDAAFSVLDAGRGLETFVLQVYSYQQDAAPREEVLQAISFYLSAFKSYILEETRELPIIQELGQEQSDERTAMLFENLGYIREHLMKLGAQGEKLSYPQSELPIAAQLKSCFTISHVSILYAVRVAIMLSIGILIVQRLHLEHGRWLLFTLASISLPYAEDVSIKAKKRLIATVTGGIASFLLFTLIPSVEIRTCIVLIAGYISFYLVEYAATFTFATIGALGGAMMSNAFGATAVASIVLIRLFYVLIGIGIAFVANLAICPVGKEQAIKQLYRRYMEVSRLLIASCRQEQKTDRQSYYALLIQSYLLEEALRRNAKALQWDKLNMSLQAMQREVRQAHYERSLKEAASSIMNTMTV